MTSLVRWVDRVPSMWDRDESSPFTSTWGSLMNGFDYFFGDASYKNDDGNMVYEIEVPGFNKDNLSINIENGMLTVQGKRETKSSKSHAGLKEIYKRLSTGDIKDADAKILDGILYVTVRSNTVNKKEVELT